MAANVAVGAFATGTGTTTVNVTGLGFDPTGVIVFGSYRGAVGNGSADYVMSIGFADGTNERGGSMFSSDGAATSNTTRGRHVTECVVAMDGTTWSGEGGITLQTGGFDVTISNSFAADVDFIYLAVGGDVSVAVGSTAMPASTGVTTNFVTGLSFQPKALITSFVNRQSTGTSTSTAGGNIALGCATGSGSTEQWVVAVESVDAQGTSDTGRYGYEGECLAGVNAFTDVVEPRASLDSFTSDGFELNFAETSSGREFIWIALGGAAEYVAGSILSRTDTTQTTETTTGVDPKALIMASVCTAESTQDTTTTENSLSIGVATSATSRYAVAATDQHGVTTMEGWTAYRSDAVYIRGDFADAEAGVMDIAELGSGSEQFEFIMDDTDPDAAFIGYLAIGDTPAAGGFGPLVGEKGGLAGQRGILA